MATKLIAGLDIGNGYVKSSVMGAGTGMTIIDIPSCVLHWSGRNAIPKTNKNDIVKELADIYNVMDVSFESPLIKDDSRCLVGARSITSGRVPEEFDVHATRKKAKQPLSAMLALACVAGKALQDYYMKNEKLPEKPIDVEVIAAMALPITEFRKTHKEYAAGYVNNDHAVTFYNFAEPIRVNVKFLNVMVNAEGAAAQYGINSKGPDVIAAMLEDIRAQGIPLVGYLPEHILGATSILGVDIGEGTVNFPVFVRGEFDHVVSTTMDKGYGEVLDRTVEILREMEFNFKSRKELTEFLNNPSVNRTTPAYQERYKKIQAVVDEELSDFVSDVVAQFGKTLSRVSADLEVIYVYGGGASPLQKELYPLMLKKAESVSGGANLVPILYMDSRYSRNLNREGLFAMAEIVAANMGKKQGNQ